MSKKRRYQFQKQGKKLSMDDITTMFPDDASAVAFIEECRWEDGKSICPKCGSNRSYPRQKINGHRCLMCSHEYTVRIGTIFENSRVPLRKWLQAIWAMVQPRLGISSTELEGLLGVKQQTAWFILHRLREACYIDVEKEGKLEYRVRLDVGCFGGKEPNKKKYQRSSGSQGGANMVKIVAAVEERRDGKGGRIRVGILPDETSKTMSAWVLKNVKIGTVIDTDMGRSFSGLEELGYIRNSLNHKKEQYKIGEATTNHVESFISTVKRGEHGVYIHWDPEHIMRYVDEYSFRLSKCPVEMDCIDRMKVMVRAAVGRRLTYDALINEKPRIFVPDSISGPADTLDKFSPDFDAVPLNDSDADPIKMPANLSK